MYFYGTYWTDICLNFHCLYQRINSWLNHHFWTKNGMISNLRSKRVFETLTYQCKPEFQFHFFCLINIFSSHLRHINRNRIHLICENLKCQSNYVYVSINRKPHFAYIIYRVIWSITITSYFSTLTLLPLVDYLVLFYDSRFTICKYYHRRYTVASVQLMWYFALLLSSSPQIIIIGLPMFIILIIQQTFT